MATKGHWRMLEPGTTKAKATARIKAEKKRAPNRKYKVSSYKDLRYGFRVYVPEVWYPG